MSKLRELGVWLASKAFDLLPTVFWVKFCEFGSGHRYSTAVLHGEASFVIDPTTGCSFCGKQMSPAVYDALTVAYAQALECDEAWD